MLEQPKPPRCQVGWGFCQSLVGPGHAHAGRWLHLALRVGQGIPVFPGDFRVGFSVFLPGVFGFFRWMVSVLFRLVFFPLLGLMVAPPSRVFLFGPFWPYFFLALSLASCIFFFRVGQQHCQKSGCNGPGPCRPSI